MTKISIRFDEKEVVKRVVESVSTVVLELTEEETKFIHDVLWRVGGSTTESRRKHSVAILAAIDSIYPEGSYEMFDSSDVNGTGIIFKPTA